MNFFISFLSFNFFLFNSEVFSFLNSSNFFKKSFKSLFLNKYPLFSLFNISWGPFLQLLDITVVLLNPASNKTKPGSSHREERTKQSALIRYWYTFSWKPTRWTLFSIPSVFINFNISDFFSPSPKIIKIYSGYFFKISLKADINNEKFFCFVSLPIPTIILLSLKSKLGIFLNFQPFLYLLINNLYLIYIFRVFF